ncbi:UNKNOWN [Stylonychia lemnae]|uniref:Uncharacterized protein n=1 Tax=Stylonychia lemnae TaxID=5949 RepID=A0A078AB15_STYLE|nr:UNKNOWN [Stylonychia lemnae]|eukprot:CDW79061.1 UNKNOWN [Stylonychia lemnae]
MKQLAIILTFILYFGICQTAIITAYQGSCTRCLGNGYNYCFDNSTCVDNRPSFCFTLYDKPMKCQSQTCSAITIFDTDVFSQKEVQFLYIIEIQYVNNLLSYTLF